MNFVVCDSVPNPSTHLRLFQEGSTVKLYVVDPRTGEPLVGGCVVTIQNDGTLFLGDGLKPEFGFSLDTQGRIQISSLLK